MNKPDEFTFATVNDNITVKRSLNLFKKKRCEHVVSNEFRLNETKMMGFFFSSLWRILFRYDGASHFSIRCPAKKYVHEPKQLQSIFVKISQISTNLGSGCYIGKIEAKCLNIVIQHTKDTQQHKNIYICGYSLNYSHMMKKNWNA